CLWDVVTAKLLRTRKWTEETVQAVLCSRNGKLQALNYSKNLCPFGRDIATGNLLPPAETAYPTSIRSPDGKYTAGWGFGGPCIGGGFALTELTKGPGEFVLFGAIAGFGPVAFSPNSKIVATVAAPSGYSKPALFLWEVAAAKQLFEA